MNQIYRNKRTYIDFKRFLECHPDIDVVEMDTVKGSRAAGKCLLTLLFRSCNFMLIILLPKGQSLYKYTQEDINLIANHINSTARDSLNGATPFDLADILLDKKIPALTGLHKVSPDSVMLKPALIERRSNSNTV